MEFYNFETRFISSRDALREYLKTNNINSWLDTQIITEV